jgi:sulfite exporter TauE/SafE
MDYLTAFVLGLVGSFHCAGMCGPLTLALPTKSTASSPFVLGRVLYNAGRIFTYCVLGLVFGVLGKTLFLAGIQRWVSIALGLILLLGLLVSKRFGWRHPAYKLIGHLKSFMTDMLRRRSLASLAVLGLLNGLLPCGLVYVAAAGAIATGALLPSVGYMAAFGAGTLPMLMSIAFFGKLTPVAFRLKLQSAIPVAVFLLATLLILRGMSLGIPYVSPDLAGASCCHK